MEKTLTNYFTRRTNAFMWISAVLAAASAALHIICGADSAHGSTLYLFLLPIASCIFYALMLVICGETRIYMTGIPVLLGCLYFFIASVSSDWKAVVLCALSVIVGFMWVRTVFGHIFSKLPLILLLLAVLALHIAVTVYPKYAANELDIKAIANAMMIASPLFAAIAIKVRPEDGGYYRRWKGYYRRWGDRYDGRRLRSLGPLYAVSPYIMKTRNTSQNFIKDSIDVGEMEKYIRAKRKEEGLSSFGITHVLLAAYVRAVAGAPGINRFVAGQKVYARDRIEVSMVVKKEMSTSAPETAIKVYFDPEDTAYDVYRKFSEKVEEAKSTPLNSSFDKTAKYFNIIPSLVLKFGVWLLTVIDYFGMLPKTLAKVSPFHGSLFITSMGSLGIPPIYHHLYDFGNLPVFIAFGHKRKQRELRADGSITYRKYVDFTVVTDERVCDGFYFATALKLMRGYMLHPEKLDVPPEKVVEDIM